MQPAADEDVERDVIISPHVVRAVVFIIIWGVLFAIASGNAGVDKRLANDWFVTHVTWWYVAALPEFLIQPACVVLVWIAFFAPERSDRALFVAGVGLTATIVLATTIVLIRQAMQHFLVDVIGFNCVAFFAACALAARSNVWRAVFALVALYGALMPYFTGFAGIASTIGSAAFGLALLEFALLASEKAGVKLWTDARQP